MNSNAVIDPLRAWVSSIGQGWNSFWFTPRTPQTIGLLRCFTGIMLLYSHIVLATDLMSFIGPSAWIGNDVAGMLGDGSFGFSTWARSYLTAIDSPALLWMHHLVVMTVTLFFAAGFLTRFTAPAAWFFQVMYLHRLTGALFGFDQIVTYSAMYLMIAPSGSCFSIDALIRRRKLGDKNKTGFVSWMFPEATPSVATNIATRLFQIHLCTIYFFGGIAKARGVTWWDGTAMWFSAANYEYQSNDLTWLAGYPTISAGLTHLTLFWEVSYAALVWPKLTRPIVLATAIAVHGGIAMFMGMITFGVMMIAANAIFIPPDFIRNLLTPKRI